MHIMFVCTGNICRSPMGELLLKRYLAGTSIQVSSAGTRGLPAQRINPSSARLMGEIGIDASMFCSRRLTKSMAQSADLILCFEKKHRKNIVTLEPRAVKYTFQINDFANMSEYCAVHGLVAGKTVQGRLSSIIEASTMIRPMIPDAPDIADPIGQPFESFQVAAQETNMALKKILRGLRKHPLIRSTVSREAALMGRV